MRQEVVGAWKRLGDMLRWENIRRRAFQSYARALYAEIIPPGEEARWYACSPSPIRYMSSRRQDRLKPCANRGFAIIFIIFGRLVVGLVADLTGNIRYTFLFLVLMPRCSLGLTSNVGGLMHARGHHHMGMTETRWKWTLLLINGYR